MSSWHHHVNSRVSKSNSRVGAAAKSSSSGAPDCMGENRGLICESCQHRVHRTVARARFALQNATKMFGGSLEVKLPTIWTDEKQSRAEAERRERLEERRVEE